MGEQQNILTNEHARLPIARFLGCQMFSVLLGDIVTCKAYQQAPPVHWNGWFHQKAIILQHLRWMEEILHQLIGGLSHYS